MKTLLQTLIMMLPIVILGQVGINTDAPQASLDIRTIDPTNPSNDEGLLIPKINEFPTTNPTATQDGMLVYATGNGSVTKGFYYWDNTAASWTPFTGSSGTVEELDDLTDAKTNNSSIFIGVGAGANDDGVNNTNIGFGKYALNSNTTEGHYNIAIGFRALNDNTEGDLNIANGAFALVNNTTGNGNIANGYQALFSNTTGTSNIAIGSTSLYSNIIGNRNIANGSGAMYSNTTGNSNIANGYQALYSNTTGGDNNANGNQALYSNTTGYHNIANGFNALYSNTIGGSNIANGFEALLLNTTGDYNIANGFRALRSNTTGTNNVANGFEALMYNTTGENNIANGYEALTHNTTGSYNIANGFQALYNNTTGGSNTVIGSSAGSNITTGSNNICVGNDAQVPDGTAWDQVRIGDTFISYAGIQVPWTTTSDARYKTDISTISNGLAFVNALRPVHYFRKEVDRPTREIGFIAQEVQSVLQDLGYENYGLISKDDKGMYSLRYNDFIPVLTKAIQEQQQQIAAQQAQIDELKLLVGTLTAERNTSSSIQTEDFALNTSLNPEK